MVSILDFPQFIEKHCIVQFIQTDNSKHHCTKSACLSVAASLGKTENKVAS